MAETDPGSETPAVVGDTWSGLPHFTCSLCGWDSMDAARLTEHLRFEHPAPVPVEAEGPETHDVPEDALDPAAPDADPPDAAEEPTP